MRAPVRLAALVALLAAGASGARRARRDRVRAVRARRVPVRAARGPARPRGAVRGTLTLNVKRVRRREQPDRTAVVGARRRPGPGRDPVRAKLASIIGARRSPPATCSCSTSAGPAARRAQLRCFGRESTAAPRRRAPPARRGARLLPTADASTTSRRSCAPPATEARALRRLLRHQGRATTPPSTRPTSRRWCSTRSCRPRAPTSSTARPSDACRGPSASCAPTAPARASRRPARRPLHLVRRARAQPARGTVVNGDGRQARALDEPDRPARHPARAAT